MTVLDRLNALREADAILREEFAGAGDTAKLAALNALMEKFSFNSQYTDDFPALIRQGQQELNALSN